MSSRSESKPQNVGVPGSSGFPSGPLRVDGLASDGRGVARDAGRVWFVERAFPGDLVELVQPRVRSTFGEGRAGRRIEDGPDRRESECTVQARCGGCPWMDLALVAQHRWKRRIVEEALVRIGGFRGVGVEEVVPSPRALGYRNRVEVVLRRDRRGRPAVGFAGFEPEVGPAVVDVERCAVLDERAAPALDAVRRALLGDPRLASLWSSPEPFRILVRVGIAGALVAIRGPRAAAAVERALTEAAERLVAGGALAGVVRTIAAAGRRGGTRSRALAGAADTEREVAGVRFRIPAGSFTQVNDEAADRLVEAVVERCSAGPGSTVLDLYGGIGAFGWRLAARGARVTVVEADERAVACGREARPQAALRTPPAFVHRDARAFLDDHAGALFDAAVANPPRTGLGRGVAERLAARTSHTIVVVSCDAATLARDLRVVVASGRWRIARVTPFDLFPHTPHVEIVTAVERTDSSG